MRFNYQRYLASREWAVLKRQVRERSGGICERCKNAPHEQTHHVTYERIGHEALGDLLGVCGPCHAYLSGKDDVDPALPLKPQKPQATCFYVTVPRGQDLSCATKLLDEVLRIVQMHQSESGVPVKVEWANPITTSAQLTLTSNSMKVEPSVGFATDMLLLLGSGNVWSDASPQVPVSD